MKIGNNNIGLSYQPFIVAEMSGNHNQSLERALEIVEAAASSGAHALKLQTYTADTITLDLKDSEFVIKDKNSLWNDRSLYELYQEAYTPWEWQGPIIKRSNELGMLCFSTPFDETAVDFLEDLNVPAYKIASFENIHLPLVEKVASTGKPMIISSGMASISELGELVQTIRDAGCNNFALLKCTSTYPASPENSNILSIPHMRELFQCEVGLSDHTMGVGAAVAGVAHGATIIEKHFNLDDNAKTVDSFFSLKKSSFKNMVNEIRNAELSLGKIYYGVTRSSKKNLNSRRSIYVNKLIKKGQKISVDNIKIVRPSYGLHPKHFKKIIGKRVNRNLFHGDRLKLQYIYKN